MKKILCLLISLSLGITVANADMSDNNSGFAQCYNAAQQYLENYQYSSAISEFKKALRLNYMDNSARIGLVNSYLARGTYLANNERKWDLAANDFRAALFYLRYYPVNQQDVQNSIQAISNTTQNLEKCLSMLKYDKTAKTRYNKGKQLRYQGFFSEAGYEFAQSMTDNAYKKNSYEQLGDIFNVLGNSTKSAEYYQRAVALDGNNTSLRLKYARILDRLDRNDDALKEYNQAMTKGGDSDVLYSLERIYRKKLATNPNDAATLTSLGAILQKQNRLDEALSYYSQASQLDGSNITTRLNIGTLHQQKKNYDLAIQAYDSILVLYPNNVEANLYKAQCLMAKGDKQLAQESFSKVLQLDSKNPQARAEIFDAIKDTMKPSEITTYLSKGGVVDSYTLDRMYDYAIELHKDKKLDLAIDYYNEVLKFRKDNPEVYLNKAIALKEKGDVATAKQILTGAKAKFPANSQIANTLKAFDEEVLFAKYDEASKFFNNGEFQKAIAEYQMVQPPTFESLAGIAACYKSMEQEKMAIDYYKKALALKQDSEVAYYLGVLYYDIEDWGNSRLYLKKSIAINPQNQRAKDLLGSVIEQNNIKILDDAINLYEKNDYAKALSLFNKILADDSKNAYAYYYKALINDANKKYQLAINDYKKAIQYDQTIIIVYYLMALDYDSLAQYKNALMNYKKYVSKTAETNEYKTYSQKRIKELKPYETR